VAAQPSPALDRLLHERLGGGARRLERRTRQRFELARTLVARGYPGLSFFATASSSGFLRGAGLSTVEFGKGEFLER
jgi:hypothetical protein